ncbi:zinc finger BED domain-containing protein RICESLEEPER 2-like [Benincasa hispida]|uniref:zinc finger BED domain-containing protein RICESLEEPER 2-like n=1 Tax=Benincasa hispida TaxID=102211 RepID=UPI0019020D75|nr:zinc finger BED domain-containing protein RICESLEEPER 2-like [Benincasa hispida]
MWTASSQKKGYMAITAHFSDDSWVLQSRLLRFVHVPHPHIGQLLSEALMELKDGLAVISDAIEKIRGTVHFWTLSLKRKEKFEGVCQIQIPCNKKLSLDCVTRWNSTFVMLKTALEYKDVFPRLKQHEQLYTYLPSDTDWNFVKEMCDRLEPLYLMTKLFSGSSYPTSNVFFEEVCEIRLELSKWLNSDVEEVQVMASRMIAKFEKYWSVIHGVLAIATVLDPRFKMRLIQFYFPQIYGFHHTVEIKRVRDLCCDLMKFYSSNSRTIEEP